jgi:hypothetical protein
MSKFPILIKVVEGKDMGQIRLCRSAPIGVTFIVLKCNATKEDLEAATVGSK